MMGLRSKCISALFASLVLACAPATAQSPETLARQLEDYQAVKAKTILELQPFRQTVTAVDAETDLYLQFVSLNPAVGAWYLLALSAGAKGRVATYHIENPDPAHQTVRFDAGPTPAIIVETAKGSLRCTPWAADGAELSAAAKTRIAYAPLCNGRLYLRNPVPGHKTNIEATTDFLRNNVWGGEAIVRFVRDNFYRDSQLETSGEVGIGGIGGAAYGPPPMQANAPVDQLPVISTLLDIAIEGTDPHHMTVGQWYPVTGLKGVFASAFQPRSINGEIFKTPGANRLDSIEANATGYMIAFDMDKFDIGYAVGTDHPALGWSPRPPASVRPRGLPGPDGINTAGPLVRLGMVNPVIANKTIGTFTAGFKRDHGAFRYGDMATTNMGHHYGFIEKGVIFSKLQPGLSTLYGLTDGRLMMKTWTEADNALLPRLRFARQNGVPLVTTDPATGRPVPGKRVTQWGPGNWSGSADVELRTLRAGMCMASAQGHEYLIYGYFSSATPSAMARTFQAYGCRHAMLLDMNALEHTYLALYVPQAGKMHVAHLVPGMAQIDKKVRGGGIIPRFIGFADNRDFFYLTHKEAQP
jgi:hypothetical protein